MMTKIVYIEGRWLTMRLMIDLTNYALAIEPGSEDWGELGLEID